MIQIGDAIVSFDVFHKRFLCDLMACKGACCVEGDAGAPLTKDEAIQIEKYFPVFKNYIDENKIKTIKEHGFSVLDKDGELVTPLYENRECAYTYVNKHGITKCAIEKAYLDKKIDFQKPISCHLFPIRIKEYPDFDAVNYQELDICEPGRECGQKNELPLYVFLKGPLIRKYGEEWFKELEIADNELKNAGYFKR